MDALNQKRIGTPYGEKSIAVYQQDIRALDEPLDVMTISAFYRSYAPVRGTLLEALSEKGISVSALSRDPKIDLRSICNIWLSRKLSGVGLPINRIGCMELSPYADTRDAWRQVQQQILNSISAYFHMLDIASMSGLSMARIGMPVPGGGHQHVDSAFTAIPMLNECFAFLKRNPYARKISIITYDERQAQDFARVLDESYAAHSEQMDKSSQQENRKQRALAFISYSSKDKNVADNLCNKLEAAGIGVWYAPRDIRANDYASAIVTAIRSCTHFITLISKNSLASNHVLNEIDLAFKELNRGVQFFPLKLDEEEMGPAFEYYLSRQHWTDMRLPPLERRLDELINKLTNR
ncbi:MAG: toll/interleukin-1 receptor domain-containing protein [Clostridia bacterium]|nr:toll/interleukin-1 receptor domain-containing protein [Clostridia bacterium]